MHSAGAPVAGANPVCYAQFHKQAPSPTMFSWLAGILAGLGAPFQTGMNLRLRLKFGSPFVASWISFAVSLLFLLAVLLLSGETLAYPWARLSGEPAWIWLGGFCGVVFLTGNVLLLPRLGGVQTVIFPVFGQILMGLIIDHFGLFHAPVSPLSLYRVLGAALLVAGVVFTALARQSGGAQPAVARGEVSLWLWRAFAVASGTLGAVQVAVNGYLGQIVHSALKSTVVSFVTGILLLTLICSFLILSGKVPLRRPQHEGFGPWWAWLGGVLGAIYVYVNVTLSHVIGTGGTVMVLLIGATLGGVLVDHFGLFGTARRPVNLKKSAGIALMLLGAAATKLF